MGLSDTGTQNPPGRSLLRPQRNDCNALTLSCFHSWLRLSLDIRIALVQVVALIALFLVPIIEWHTCVHTSRTVLTGNGDCQLPNVWTALLCSAIFGEHMGRLCGKPPFRHGCQACRYTPTTTQPHSAPWPATPASPHRSPPAPAAPPVAEAPEGARYLAAPMQPAAYLCHGQEGCISLSVPHDIRCIFLAAEFEGLGLPADAAFQRELGRAMATSWTVANSTGCQA
jgi:hypothetical protein